MPKRPSRRLPSADPLWAALDAEHARRRALRAAAGIFERRWTREEEDALFDRLLRAADEKIRNQPPEDIAVVNARVKRLKEEWLARRTAAKRELALLAARHARRRRRWLEPKE